MDDSKIIELFYERSEQAIIELSKKYGAVCTRVANNILNNRQDTEECVNDAYLGAWNTIPPQNPNPLLSYVCRIVRNLAVNRYHATTAAKRDSSYDVALDELENCFSAACSVEDELDAREVARIIDDFLANGAALTGLIQLVEDAGAELVGAGIAIEKAFQPGGDLIRRRGVRVESLARVSGMSVEGGVEFC